MGIHVNGDHNEVNVVHGDVTYGNGCGEHPSNPPIGLFGLFFFVLVLVAVVVKFWWIFLIAASVGALTYAAWLAAEEKDRAVLAARRKREALAARAEDQNSAYLRGEARGVYGRFPPPPEVGP